LTSTLLLALAVFGACAVESVEALTLVLAAGSTRGWRSAFEGAAAALAVLTVLVAVVGVPLIHYVPLDALRVVIGALLLVLGLSWLRKATLRASGRKALHDEDAIYRRTVADLAATPPPIGGRSAVGFAVAFKGVLLEGTEVVLIVVSLGASDHRLGLASAMAAAAAVVVTAVGVMVARQLREVPENTLKFGVGIMLTSFGVFWVGEGAGLRWPGRDAAILVLILGYLLLSVILVRWLRATAPGEDRASPTSGPVGDGSPVSSSTVRRVIEAFGRFWWEFFIGDTPEIFLGTLLVLGAALAWRHQRLVAIPLVLLLTLVTFAGSTFHGLHKRPADDA